MSGGFLTMKHPINMNMNMNMNILSVCVSGRVVGEAYIYAWSGRPINARLKKPLLRPWAAALLPGVGHPRPRAEGNIEASDTRPPSFVFVLVLVLVLALGLV